MLKIMSINTRGMGNKGKIDWVRDLCRSEMPGFLGIQESKMGSKNMDFVEKFWHNSDFGFAQVEANGRSGGIISVWDKSVFCGLHAHGDEDFLAVVGQWIGVEGLIGVVNTYGPRDEGRRLLEQNL